MTELPPLHFAWRRTWPDEPHDQDDWVASPYEGYPSCLRIRKDKTTHGHVGEWHWIANGGVLLGRGWEPNAKLAARAAEAEFLKALAEGRTRPLGTKTASEIYARESAPEVDIDY